MQNWTCMTEEKEKPVPEYTNLWITRKWIHNAWSGHCVEKDSEKHFWMMQDWSKTIEKRMWYDKNGSDGKIDE